VQELRRARAAETNLAARRGENGFSRSRMKTKRFSHERYKIKAPCVAEERQAASFPLRVSRIHTARVKNLSTS
jgi:hypothetical protein